MSFAVSQAETFNYKTNYAAASVSPLTQPGPEQDRAYSGATEQLRRCKQTKSAAASDSLPAEGLSAHLCWEAPSCPNCPHKQ